MGDVGTDINEKNDILTPHLRGIDGVKPSVAYLEKAAKAGVTTICVGPGSSNIVGGTFAAIKTVGICVDDMLIRDGVAMKCAFGENPKRHYANKRDCSRMTTAAILRELLFKTREYMRKKDAAGGDWTKYPSFDMKLESMIPVLRRDMPMKVHAHETEDIFTALRIAKEFDLRITLEHVTEGHLIVRELAEANVPLAVGPLMCNGSKVEVRNMDNCTAGMLAAAGCQVSIITDAPVIRQEFLPIIAGMAVKAGMDPFQALQAITINPARHIGVEDRVGSLEVGKDADIVITDGDPFESMTNVELVMIDGKTI
jgi:imidazolonepropionase-like amidohydrolase